MGDDKRRPPDLLYHAGHRVRLPRSRNAEQGLRPHPSLEARGELLYSPRLVASRAVFAVYLELIPSFDAGPSRRVLCRSDRPPRRLRRTRAFPRTGCPSRCRTLLQRASCPPCPPPNYTPRASTSHPPDTALRGTRGTTPPSSSSPPGRDNPPLFR